MMMAFELKHIMVRRVLNLAGGLITMASLALPWAVIGGSTTVSVFQPNSFVWFVPWMVLAGGVASMVSRYGGLVTIAALAAYAFSPPIYFVSTVGSATTGAYGIGFWLAVVGAGSSIIGTSWTLPFPPTTLLLRKH